ncbi:IS3 family transposase, partial [Tritonibacter mobilis]|uniref:IS3 family transposase n=2 Tax=Alphaproteobacteria TaxID=28211 RepID=UPI001C943680
MIKRDHPELSISQQCKLVRLSRSAFYYTPVGVNPDTLALMKEIDRVFTKYPFFGSRQIAAYLRREGTTIGRHRVRQLMAKMGLEAIYKRPRTSQPHPQHPVYPYLLRKMQIDRPNQVELMRWMPLRAASYDAIFAAAAHSKEDTMSDVHILAIDLA